MHETTTIKSQRLATALTNFNSKNKPIVTIRLDERKAYTIYSIRICLSKGRIKVENYIQYISSNDIHASKNTTSNEVRFLRSQSILY